MTNAWSFLYDAMNEDKIDFTDAHCTEFITMNSNSDYMESFNYGNTVSNGDKIEFDIIPGMDLITESKGTPWKYNEEEIVKELLEYIRGTYKQHYAANDENIQTLDFIEAAHKDGEAFCRDNILKYTSRYDKKGTADRDIMKIQHYAVLLKFFRNKNNNRETYPQ